MLRGGAEVAAARWPLVGPVLLLGLGHVGIESTHQRLSSVALGSQRTCILVLDA